VKQESRSLAARIRIGALEMVQRARAAHIGGALSMADVLAVLYQDILQCRPDEPSWERSVTVLF